MTRAIRTVVVGLGLRGVIDMAALIAVVEMLGRAAVLFLIRGDGVGI